MNYSKYRRLTTKKDGSIIWNETPVKGYTVQQVTDGFDTRKYDVCLYTVRERGRKELAEKLLGSFEFPVNVWDEEELDDFDYSVKQVIRRYQSENGYTGTTPIRYKIKGDPFSDFFMDEYDVDELDRFIEGGKKIC